MEHAVNTLSWAVHLQVEWFQQQPDLGPGPGVSHQLFVSVPASPILAELQVETGHKGSKHATALSQDTCRGEIDAKNSFYQFQ